MEWTIDSIREYIININPNCKLLSDEYVSYKNKLKIKCSCGQIFERSLDNIVQRKSCTCSACSRKNSWSERKIFLNSNRDIINRFQNEGYKVLNRDVTHYKNKVLLEDCDGYRGYSNLRDVELKRHFSIFSIKFNEDNLLYNLNNFCELNNINTKVIDYWEDGRQIRIKCICQCGEEYVTNVGDFTTQNRFYCKKCTKSESINEKLIEKELIKYNISFIKQKRFDNCRNPKTNYMLPFDFYLDDLNIIIEVDGQQHEKPVNFNGCSDEEAIKEYNNTIIRDNIKNIYCKNNDITLIRINYKDVKNNNYKQIIQSVLV